MFLFYLNNIINFSVIYIYVYVYIIIHQNKNLDFNCSIYINKLI